MYRVSPCLKRKSASPVRCYVLRDIFAFAKGIMILSFHLSKLQAKRSHFPDVTHLAIRRTAVDMELGKCFATSGTCRPQMTPQLITCKLTSLQLFYCNIDTKVIYY